MTGEWIRHDGAFSNSRECSVCHCWMPWVMNYINYCPNCGADMREERKCVR